MLNAVERKSLLRAAKLARHRPMRRSALAFDSVEAAKAIGAALRASRNALGMSQRDVADKLGTHRPIVGRVERGVHPQDLTRLARHMHVARMPMKSLLTIISAMER